MDDTELEKYAVEDFCVICETIRQGVYDHTPEGLYFVCEHGHHTYVGKDFE